MARPGTKPLWLVVIGEGRVLASALGPEPPLRIGSGAGVELRIDDPSVPALAGSLEADPRGALEYREAGAGRRYPVRPGTHLRIGAVTLAALAVPAAPGADPGRAGGELAERLVALLPRLWGAAREEDACGEILEALREALGAEWGAFLRTPAGGPGPWEVAATRGRRRGRADDRVSRRLLEALADRRAPLLASDVAEDPDLQAVDSIHAEVRSVIADRIESEGRLVGAFYLESRSTRHAFTPAERDLLGASVRLAGGLLAAAEQARGLARENERLDALRRAGEEDRRRQGPALGSSPAMRAVLAQARKVAESGVTGLLLGETGTGKEVLARTIHALSPRAGKPFVAVHCMALPRDLVESELFGHVKGAFSGAERDRMGRFEMADGGVLFLDEVGELSPELQVKLLRVLEARAVERLGEARSRPVDVHLVAATNADLGIAIKAGRFREDLFYRLSVFQLRIPPLRERDGDVLELARAFLAEFARQQQKALDGFDPAAAAALAGHRWPGNVRELRNSIQQAVVRAEGPRIRAADLDLAPPAAGPAAPAPAPAPGGPEPRALAEAQAAWERGFLLRALAAEKGNVAATVRRLGLARSALYRKLDEHGIDPGSLRA